MTGTDPRIAEFLRGSPWEGWTRRPLAGDASNRRYERLTGPDGQSVVLMDADPARGEDVRPFIVIGQWLRQNGFSAPEILAEDRSHGLLMLEDLGDALFARVVRAAPDREESLYEAATDLLAALHRAPAPAGLPVFDPALMAQLAGLAFEWYGQDRVRPGQSRAEGFAPAFRPLLARHAAPAGVVALRDFHAENLIWLPDRQGHARIGLLDFQDAVIGHPAYDLVSLLRDARRDVSAPVQARMLTRFAAAGNADPDAVAAAFAVISVQRNLRILGVFARLSMHFGKPHYVDLIPRVWGHLMTDLAHPALDPVRERILDALPAPSPAHLQDLKDRCATVPTP